MAAHSSTLAWWAAVRGVAKSRTRLSDFTFTFMHWRRKWQPTPVFFPGESHGRGVLVGCSLWGRTESDTTEATQLAAAAAAAVSTQEWHLVATRMNYSSSKGQVRESFRVISSILQVTRFPDFTEILFIFNGDFHGAVEIFYFLLSYDVKRQQ